MNAWTLDKLEQASKRWKNGETVAQIARVLNVSPNSITGLSGRHRELFPERLPPASLVNHVLVMKIEKSRKAAAAKRAEEKRWSPPVHVEFVPGIDAVDLPPAIGPVRLVDLPPLSCHWPVSGSGAGTLFCAAQTGGATYCQCHFRLAYGGSSSTARKG